MGKLTEEVFNESCCDGGATSDVFSCQPCGCDPGANHICEACRAKGVVAFTHMTVKMPTDQSRYLGTITGIQETEDAMRDTVPAFLTGMTVTLDEKTSVTSGGVPAWADRAWENYTGEKPPVAEHKMRQFETGATRNDTGDKFDYEGFINPEVLHAFGEYMHLHRRQRDGSVRDSDNWQRGIPFQAYTKSLVRHVIDLWRMERGFSPTNPDTNAPHTKEELCCAIMFNVMGYLKELLDPSAINEKAQV